MTDSLREANIKENRHILKSVAEAILYCGRQCIALRGDNENPDKGKATKKESEDQSTESGNETHAVHTQDATFRQSWQFLNLDEANFFFFLIVLALTANKYSLLLNLN